MSCPTIALMRLRVVADPDPGAIARVLERFQNLNILPRRVSAEFGIDQVLHMEVDVCGVAQSQLNLIVGKIRQAPSIVNAYWHRV